MQTRHSDTRRSARSWMVQTTCIALLVVAALPFGDNANIGLATQPDKIDAYVTAKLRAYQAPGAAIAVVENGRVTLKRAYGIANLETDTPVKTNSVFELASVTKPFTATAVMILVEAGKLRLDDSINTWLTNAPESWKGITIRHLLNHTAGFPAEVYVQSDGSALLNTNAKQEFEAMVKAPLLFPAGERAQYSDPGYILLGMVIEKAAGQSYREFIQKRIFEPLQMADSSVLDQWRIIKNRVSPYALRNGKLLRGRRDWQVEVPSNFGLFSTVEDLAKFDAALVNETLVKKPSLAQMWTAAKLNNGLDAQPLGALDDAYGLGWLVGDLRGHRAVQHGGFSGTHLLRLPDDGLTIIVLTNLDLASGNRPGEIARGIAGLLKPELQSPHSMTPQADPAPSTTQQLQTLLSEIAEGNVPAGATTTYQTFFHSAPPRFREYAQQLRSLRSFTYITSDEVAGRGLTRMGEPIVRICYYQGELENKSFHFTFWLTKAGKVAYLRFNPA